MTTAGTVLLVHPPIYDFTAFDLYLYPLGLLETARAFEARGFRVLLADALDRWHPRAADSGGAGRSLRAPLIPSSLI